MRVVVATDDKEAVMPVRRDTLLSDETLIEFMVPTFAERFRVRRDVPTLRLFKLPVPALKTEHVIEVLLRLTEFTLNRLPTEFAVNEVVVN